MFERPESFEASKAIFLARASCAAYLQSMDEIVSLLEIDPSSCKIDMFASGDTEGFILADAQDCVVAFRGSASVGDWVNNAIINLTEWPGEGLVHEGFLAALDLVWEPLSELIQRHAQNRKLYLCGHSLGGALAVLAAMRLRHEQNRLADGIYTYGMPKIGDDAFADAVNTHHEDRCFTFLNEGDFVPWLPIVPNDFAVCGHGIRFDSTGNIGPRPHALGAALLMLVKVLGKPQEEWLNLNAHSKEEYQRLVGAAFS